jgi:uncharacterized protein
VLLRFRTENHRSLRDAAELSLMSSKTRVPVPKGGWVANTTRVAGIFGPNASGKSNMLDALDFLRRAIAYSATRWGDREQFPYHPFALNTTSKSMPSTYEVDITVKDVRYTYGFASDASGVQGEWLYSYPSGRPRKLFERSSPRSSDINFGRTLPGENATIRKLVRPTALFLSVAANNNHPTLSEIHHEIARHIQFAKFTHHDKEARIRFATELIKDPDLLRQAVALLRFADLGITHIELAEVEIDDETRSFLSDIVSTIRNKASTSGNLPTPEQFFEQIKNQIRFIHAGEGDGETYRLELVDQSAGTIAWLSIGIPALLAMKHGDTFLVDEIDSSLHPRLSAALVRMFKDSSINRTGAQLIFTSHDSSLMGKMIDDVLHADEIWFTEKQNTGTTEFYALQEFQHRSSDNFELRYLQGRYGAVPMVDPEEMRAALADSK